MPLWEGKTTSNVDITAGDALTRDSNGRITTATSADSSVLGVAAEAVTGVAATPGEVLFYPAIEDAVFSGQLDSGYAASADYYGYLFKGVSLIATSSGNMELDGSFGTNSQAQIIGFKDGTELATYAEVLFVWAKSAFAGEAYTA
jgi:hypothetical protein